MSPEVRSLKGVPSVGMIGVLEFLDIAINVEQRAVDVYGEMIEQMTGDLVPILESIRNQEKKHRETLFEFRRKIEQGK